jgi:CTP:molybdopterin cytidylyltransferase MocA
MKMADEGSENEMVAIILAAGKSERFGKPKAFLKFSEKKSFLEKLLKVYIHARVKKIVVVTNEEIYAETKSRIETFIKQIAVSVIINKHPEAGRFTSIRLGTDAVAENSAAFIQNIDNPFTTSLLIEKMRSKLEQGKYVVPVCKGEKGHPVLLSSEIVQHIRKVSDAEANLRNILEGYSFNAIITNDELIHANINTEKEYQKYFADETIE